MNIQEFKNPGAIYRNAPFWSWNEKFDKGELERQIDEMVDKGWGSFFMHARVGYVTGYLSEEWMEFVKVCAEKARQTGSYAWLYDEDRWPSGFAAGKVPMMDEKYRSRRLVLLRKDEVTENDRIFKKYSESGIEYCICKRVDPLGLRWYNGTCYVDLMNPEMVKAFLDTTHEKYKEACGEYFGKEIPGIFTDEPCYIQPKEKSVPWTDNLPSIFEERKGYSLNDCLEDLFFDIEGRDYHKVRYDFYDCITRLFVESFTKQYYDWCENNRLIMTGHYLYEDNHVRQVKYIGAAMPHYEFMHWPGVDKLLRHIEQHVTIRQLSSVADQLGKERAVCEAFGITGQQVNFFHRKWIGDWMASLGINFVNSHLSSYSMRGERKRDCPPNLFYQQPWWEDERKYADYTGRLCYLLAQGKREVDILVLHTISSVWSEYSPLHESNHYMAETELYDKPFQDFSYKLTAEKLDHHYGDEIIMENHARIENGQLVIGRHQYSTIVVPPALTMGSNTARLIAEFAETAPERVIFIGKVPGRVDGEIKDINLPEGVKVAATMDQAVELLKSYYTEGIIVTDVMTGKNASRVMCHSRTIENGKLVFLNNSDEIREARTRISIPASSAPFILDLMTGKIYRTSFLPRDGKVLINAKLFPAGSLMLYFTDDIEHSGKSPLYLDSGVEFENQVETKEILRSFKVTPLEQNVMPIHKATVHINGGKVVEGGHISKIWHNLFYCAPEGTPFKAEYSFEVEKVPDGEILAAVECAENLDGIALNGVSVKPLKERGEWGIFDKTKSWKDISFTKVPLTGLVKRGKNVVSIEGRKSNNIVAQNCHRRVEDPANHVPTECETIYIIGDFHVINEDNTRFVITKDQEVSNPADLTSGGLPFYAGSVKYECSFEYNKSEKNVYIKVNNVNAASTRVYMNGRRVDVKYWRPYIYDVTEFARCGSNKLEVVITTTLFNLMGPNWNAEITEARVSRPASFVNFDMFTENNKLLPFGISNISLMEES